MAVSKERAYNDRDGGLADPRWYSAQWYFSSSVSFITHAGFADPPRWYFSSSVSFITHAGLADPP